MIFIKRLASLLCLALCCSGYSNAEDYATGNLVGNTGNAWTGCYSNQSGAFWGGVSGGPCPGYDSSTGQIIYSYGQHTLSQTIGINQALANAGSGLQINGYNYAWSVKNSNINGQQPGGYDSIAYIDVNLYSNTGSLLVNDRYNYGYYLPQWTQFSGTRTYASPYALAGVGNLQLSVTSKDSGFWAGYYGPEFMNFSLSVNYSTNPCATNPLYNSSCPGYGAAMLASLNTSTSNTTPTTTYNASSGYTSVALTPDSTRTDPTITNAGGVELSTTGTITVPDNMPAVTREVLSNATSSKEDRRENNLAVTGIALTLIRRNAEREQSIARDVLRTNEQQSLQVRSNQDSFATDLVSRVQEQSQNIALNTTVTSVLSLTSIRSQQIETAVRSEETNNTSSGLTGPNNQLQNHIQPRLPEQTTNQSTGSSVNRAAPNSSLAGGVDIASIARNPVGFEQYLNAMNDRSFYEPREIYRGQRTVDNARAERFLNNSSEIRHQMMIEQQYNLGR